MTASDLKYATRETEPYFFTHKTMKFFGDTMRNYGVRSATINTYGEEGVECWELYRRHAVKHGLCSSAYFRKDTLARCFEIKPWEVTP
jgi:hypothetical protein